MIRNQTRSVSSSDVSTFRVMSLLKFSSVMSGMRGTHA